MQNEPEFQRAQPAGATGKLTGVRGSHVDCTIRWLDCSGAIVEIGSSRIIPVRVGLWEDVSCSIYNCKVRWRRRRLVGLEFVSPLKRAEPALNKLQSAGTAA